MSKYLKPVIKFSKLVTSRTTASLLCRSFGLSILWHFVPWWFFAFIAVIIFSRSKIWPYNFATFYLIVIVLTRYSDSWMSLRLINTSLIDKIELFRILFVVLFGLLFFFILGIKELFFVHRKEICLVATSLTFFLIAFFALWSLVPGSIIFSFFPFSISCYFLQRSLSKFRFGILSAINNLITSLLFTFLLTELIWALTYGPFSILIGSIFLTVIFFLTNLINLILDKDRQATQEIIDVKFEEIITTA